MRDIRRSHDAPERSIRNIAIKRKSRHEVTEDYEDDEYLPEEPVIPKRRRSKGPKRFWLWALLVVIVCAAFGALLSTVFAGASVTVYPRTQEVTVPATLKAQLNAPVGTLNYETLSITRSATTTVPAQGTQHVSRAASGVITIANSYSTASQRLIANTRFEASDGKIYRIRDSVVVPGMSGNNPGTVTATVYADSPGESYNKSGTTSFTIPGFKGDPRYAKFVAVAQGITGGFVGDEPAVAANDLANAKQQLQKQLDADVRTAAASAIPEGYSAIPGTLSVEYGDLLQTAGQNKTATLSQSATARGAIVRQSGLAAAIARATVQSYSGEAVAFGQNAMTIQATSTKPGDTTLTLALNGKATLVWQFDPNALKQALLGKQKSELETIVKAFQPAVAKATVSIRPFWQSTFPREEEKIQIKIDGQ